MARQGLEDLQTLAALDRSCRGIIDDRLAVSALEMQWYMRNQLLRDTDWASMAHSLEVRVPLVDATLLETVARAMVAPGAVMGKGPLARAPKLPLPEAITSRAKTGFSTPVGSWVDSMIAGTSAPALVNSARAPWARRWAFHVASQQAPGLGAAPRAAA
jgi:asparagine synthase (glutamine-hydrolysing)